MRNIARRLDRLEQKSGTKEKRFIWVNSPEELERRRAERNSISPTSHRNRNRWLRYARDIHLEIEAIL